MKDDGLQDEGSGMYGVVCRSVEDVVVGGRGLFIFVIIYFFQFDFNNTHRLHIKLKRCHKEGSTLSLRAIISFLVLVDAEGIGF